jgi:hypothetical protein
MTKPKRPSSSWCGSGSGSGAGAGGNNTRSMIGLCIVMNMLVFQLSGLYHSNNNANDHGGSADSTNMMLPSGGGGVLHPHPMLDIPIGKAVALPSVRVVEETKPENVDGERKFYGGKGDKAHLGGFANQGIDMMGVSPAAWKVMIERHGIKSLLDVGCGRGVSTTWFSMHGVDVHCVEGSHDAVLQTYLPLDKITEHDFSRGPWWPPTTVDAVWTVELLEHVGRNFHKNLMPSLRKAALVYATHSTWGGWHHVEVHSTDWWIARFQSFGFIYSEYLSNEVKTIASAHKEDPAPNGEKYNAQHIWVNMMVFINPTVASLPQHHHLLSELACYEGDGKKRPCSVEQHETPPPPDYEPLVLTDKMDADWEKLVFGGTNITV